MREKVEDFLNFIAVEKEYSGNTIAAYQNDLNQFIAFAEEHGANWHTVDREFPPL